MSQEAQAKAFQYFDNWKFWVSISYFAIVACIVSLYVLFGRQADEAARRQATQTAAASQQVSQCVNAVRNRPDLLRLLNLIGGLADNSIRNTKAARTAQPDSPLDELRAHSIAVLSKQKQAVTKFINATNKSTPTHEKCVVLARKLRVPLLPSDDQGR